MVAEANKRFDSVFGIEIKLAVLVVAGNGKDTSTLMGGSMGKRGATYLSELLTGVEETILRLLGYPSTLA